MCAEARSALFHNYLVFHAPLQAGLLENAVPCSGRDVETLFTGSRNGDQALKYAETGDDYLASAREPRPYRKERAFNMR